MSVNFILAPAHQDNSIVVSEAFKRLDSMNNFSRENAILNGDLDRAIARASLQGAKYVLVIDEFAAKYISAGAIRHAAEKMNSNSMLTAVGFTLDRKYNQIISQGYLQNSCTLWRVSDLMEIQAFSTKLPREVSVLAELSNSEKKTSVINLHGGPTSILPANELAERISTKWKQIYSDLCDHGTKPRKIVLMRLVEELAPAD